MLMSDGFGRIKRWDLNHFNDDAHAEEVDFIFTRLGHQSWTDRRFRCCVRRTLLDPRLNGLAGIITVNSFSNI